MGERLGKVAPWAAALALPLAIVPLVGIAVALAAAVASRKAGRPRAFAVASLAGLLALGFSAAFLGCQPRSEPPEDLRSWEALDRLYEPSGSQTREIPRE